MAAEAVVVKVVCLVAAVAAEAMHILVEAAAEAVIMIQPVVGSCKAEPAVLASCASACTKKANNKLKGEQLCTTL